MQRIPTAYVDGRVCYVDFGRRAFRSADGAFDRVDFASPRGRAMWEQLMILTCPRCQLVVVEARHTQEVRCDGCGRWLC